MKATIGLLVLFANLINVPPNLIPQNGSSTASSKDRKSAWSADWGMESTEVEGKKAVRFTEKGSGHLSNFPQEVRWSIRSLWLASSTFLPLNTDRTVTDSSGKILLEEKKHFNREAGTVSFERREAGKPVETQSLEVPDDTLAVEGLAGVLRFATIDKSTALSVHVLTNEPRVYNVTFEWRGEERIKTEAGEFECYKVEMVPHLGVLNLFRPFLPKAYFWFTVMKPHNWIRYQGPESGQGTPDVVMDLTSTSH